MSTKIPEIFRTIEFRKPVFSETAEVFDCIGYLCYKRPMYPGYDWNKGDEFDEQILQRFEILASRVNVFLSTPLMWKDQEKELVTKFKSQFTQDFILQILPKVEANAKLEVENVIYPTGEVRLKIYLFNTPATLSITTKLYPEYGTLCVPHETVKAWTAGIKSID